MQLFKSLAKCTYKYNDRLYLKLVQADSNDGKLRLASTNGHCLVSYTFKKFNNDKYYYVPNSVVKELANADKFKFNNGKLNEFKLIEDGESIKVCDNKVTLGSYKNQKAQEHFPNIDIVIPTYSEFRFKLNRRKLVEAIKNEEHVQLKFIGSTLKVFSAKHKPKLHKFVVGKNPKASIKLEVLNNEFNDMLYFDADFLRTVLNFTYNDIEVAFNNRVSAFCISYEDEKIAIKNLVMPMFNGG